MQPACLQMLQSPSTNGTCSSEHNGIISGRFQLCMYVHRAELPFYVSTLAAYVGTTYLSPLCPGFVVYKIVVRPFGLSPSLSPRSRRASCALPFPPCLTRKQMAASSAGPPADGGGHASMKRRVSGWDNQVFPCAIIFALLLASEFTHSQQVQTGPACIAERLPKTNVKQVNHAHT